MLLVDELEVSGVEPLPAVESATNPSMISYELALWDVVLDSDVETPFVASVPFVEPLNCNEDGDGVDDVDVEEVELELEDEEDDDGFNAVYPTVEKEIV